MDQNEIVKILRSCLISCKGGVKLENLKGMHEIIINYCNDKEYVSVISASKI